MGLIELEQILVQDRILPTLTELLPARSACFLVGGAIRDALQNRLSRDYDFATACDPSDLARAFAQAVGGRWFMLDARRRQSRVVAGQGADGFICDFAPFRASDLDGDLLLRDFTINAMAVPLQHGRGLGALHDPLDGQGDLHRGLLRSCSAQVLSDDPLRVLKGLRHCLCLQLAIEPSTLTAMRRAAPRLDQVAPERIRKELAAMLAVTPARRGLLWLQELDLLELLFGAAAKPATKPAAAGAGLALLGRAEQWLAFLCQAGASRQLNDFFEQELEQGVSRAVVIKLAAWLAGQGVADAFPILQKLRFSRAVQNAVNCLLSLDSPQAAHVLQLPPAGRSRALWADDLGSHPQLALCYLGLLLPVPHAAAAEVLLPILDDLHRHRVEGRVPALVAGQWLQQTLQLQGPEVGRYLAALRGEEIAGRVLTAQQAEQFLLGKLRKTGQKND